MTSNTIVLQRVMFCFCILLFVSCQKIRFEDFIHPDNTLKQCRVKQILEFNSFNSDTLIWDFKYNNLGDPIRITPSLIGTGSPEIFFRYDNQHRLTDYFGAYRKEISAGEFWHHYAHQGNKLVRDTIRGPVNIVNGEPVPTPFEATTVHYFGYDALGRIIRDSSVFTWGNTTSHNVVTSYYDANGNLANENNNYDNKVNINRTNRIWMFINANYSVNNRVPAESYNQYGLPLKWRLGSFGNVFIYRSIDSADIKYECR